MGSSVISRSAPGIYLLSSLWPSSTLPWVAPSFLPFSSFAQLPLGMRFSWNGATGVRVLVFVNFANRLTLKFTKAPGPSGDRGGWPWRALRWCAPRWPGCTFFWQVPVQFCGPWSCWPQPLGSGGDATPCEDTRQDQGRSFKRGFFKARAGF